MNNHPELSPVTLKRLHTLQLTVALAGSGALVILGLYWLSLGYPVAGVVAFAGSLGWTAGIYPDKENFD